MSPSVAHHRRVLFTRSPCSLCLRGKHCAAAILWLALGICLAGDSFAAEQGAAPAERGGLTTPQWQLETVEMLDGSRYEGYIESQDDAWLNLIQIQRPKGQPMYLVIRPLERAKVASLSRLGEQQRAQLRQRIEQFLNRARIEAGRMEAIRLDEVTRDGARRYRYHGQWFSLESSGDETTTRRIAVRMEQIFTAYRQILAPRTSPQRPLRLVVFASMSEYEAFLKRLGIAIQNPACFIAEENLVVAGSETARISAELAKINQQHARLDAELDHLEKQMPARLAALSRKMHAAGALQDQIAKALASQRRDVEDQLKKKRVEVQRANRENERTFQTVTREMFARLYHEAFHAYLENYVYPRRRHDVPLWLNEGLAQVFEAGLLEADALRIDGPNADALKALKAELAGKHPLSLQEVLAARQQAFLAGSDANRYYAYAWGLAYYLAFQQRVLGSPSLDRYVQPAAAGTKPVERFEKLVDMPIDKFTDAWQEWILQIH